MMAHGKDHNAPRLLSVLCIIVTLAAAPVAVGAALSAEQQDAVQKLKSLGASVVAVAADDDGLAVNLALAGKAAGDGELTLVGALADVASLNLRGTGVTDAGLASIAGLTSLTHLQLEQTAVTDAGLAHLKGLTNLTYLNLYGTAVTDEGLGHLAGLKNLRRLYLWQTKVTDGGVAALQAANPDLAIDRGEAMNAPSVASVVGPAPMIAMKVEPGDLRVDEQGFVRAWLVLAPIPLDGESGAEELDRQQVPDEKDLRPEPGEKVKLRNGSTLAWSPVKADDYFFDLNAALGSVNNSVAAYAVVYLDAAEERRGLRLLMGSNDQGKVYVNGVEVVKSAEGRTIERDQNAADGVTLRRGTNVVVFKVVNESNNWQGALRFTTAEGRPATDLAVKLSPTGKPLPAPAVAVNLLQPAGDPAHWSFEQHEGATGRVAAADGGGIVFDVARVTDTDWHVQAFQNGIDLADGTRYTLTFKAKSDAERTVRVSAGIQEDDWHGVGLDEEVELGPNWRDYALSFTARDVLPKRNRVGFVLGTATGRVYVKDMTLTQR